jgi:WD40 repeat protein
MSATHSWFGPAALKSRSTKSGAGRSDGRRILTASRDNTVRIWDVATAKEVLAGSVPSNDTESAAPAIPGLSPSSAAFLSNLSLQPDELPSNGSEVKSAAFSPAGSQVVVALADGTARIWDVHFATMSTQDVLTDVCKRRLRPFCPQEAGHPVFCVTDFGSTLLPNERRLAGYPDNNPPIDVCDGISN